MMQKALRFAILSVVVMNVSGCSHLERILRGAAREKGTAEARVTLPDWPKDCRAITAHAPLVVGAEIRSILKRERTALERQNARTMRCAEHYDGLKEGLK